jgi:hypothetical protein
MPKHSLPSLLAACLLIGGSTEARAAVPAQFIAKMYTEALGRAPDPQGWNSALEFFQASGCNQPSLTNWGSSVFSSVEFNALAYDNAALTLILYRSILNREPDTKSYQSSFAALESGQAPGALVSRLFGSAEFSSLVSTICSANSYSFGAGAALAIAIPTSVAGGYSSLSESQLQSLLDSTAPGQTVFLQQESVVFITQPLTIPAGVTLATYGLPNPSRHGVMARLIRAAPFAAPMIQINLDANPNPSGTLKSIWVDGQRTQASAFVSLAINVEIYGGTGATVDSNFIANSLGWSNVHSFGSLDGRPCGGNTITNNVITAYSSLHTGQEWTDGISAGCENSTVQGNQIVDPTDVGIVVFTAYPATQSSKVTHNVVISAGNSAFGAMGFDPLQNRSAGAPDFTGATLSDNTLWSGPNTHFIIGLAVGTRPWYANGSIGYGATATGNTTAGVQTQFGAGIVVSGMEGATVQGDVFDASLIPQSWTNCPIGNVLASVSAGFASGSIQSYTDIAVNGCMSDNSATAQASALPTNTGSERPQATISANPSLSDSGGGGALDRLGLILLAAVVFANCMENAKLKRS